MATCMEPAAEIRQRVKILLLTSLPRVHPMCVSQQIISIRWMRGVLKVARLFECLQICNQVGSLLRVWKPRKRHHIAG